MLKRLANVCVRSTGPAQKRFRSKPKGSRSRPKYPQAKKPQFLQEKLNSPFLGQTLGQTQSAPPDHLTPETASKYFEAHVAMWANDPRTLARYQTLGLSQDNMIPILTAFADAGVSGFFSTPKNQVKYQLARFSHKVTSLVPQWSPVSRQFGAEITFSNIFFAWCRESSDSAVLDTMASKGTINRQFLDILRHLAQIASRRPAEEFPFTRRIQRKVIMHVGPTNSGKTHHALRALAAAKTGVYAGPLRLLAHEIWERLNLGQIIPLGVDQPPPNVNGLPATPIPTLSPHQTAAIYSSPKAIHESSGSIYARATNMLTGEERKIVERNAGLLSCTVEMLSSRMEYDVGVVDEIQMIGDPERGHAWTAAVLGLSAKELHLCGEASAIPIVKSLLHETGDDLEIREYQRLTPLLVEEQSLGGDLSKIQKGDCVVAFSRKVIFALKNEIEKNSGLKCAVVYGKLPPEIRSEQAALFNDPNSGFDVIIGSDAIGMGLNLKIRRIIFSAVTKGDGGSHSKIPLSISQAKQIAGRAGRYGHSIDSSPAGYVTTLYEKDLPFIKDALSHESTPTLQYAYISPTSVTMEAFYSALPIFASASTLTPKSDGNPPSVVPRVNPSSYLEPVQMAHIYLSSLPPNYKYVNTSSLSSVNKLVRMCSWIEEHAKGMLTWEEKETWLNSPVAWRDDLVVKCITIVIRKMRDNMDVGDIKAVLKELGVAVTTPPEEGSKKMEFMEVLEWTEEQMRRHSESLEALALGEKEGKSVGELELVEEEESQQKEDESSTSVLASQPQVFIPYITDSTLSVLESFHRILVFYMWMFFRNSVIFSDLTTVEELKKRVEVALDWSLSVINVDDQELFGVSKNNDKKKRKLTKEKEEKLRKAKGGLMQLREEFAMRNKTGEKEKGKSVWSDGTSATSSSSSSSQVPSTREDSSASSSSSSEGKRGSIGVMDSAELRAKSRRQWVQAPDLSTLLKNYVENPGLRVGRGGAGEASNLKSVRR